MIRPYTRDGFPLPTIKEWNMIVGDIQEDISKSVQGQPLPVFRGSVEDLSDTNCGHCSGELIRQTMGHYRIFISGVIYCNNSLIDESHPQEYWIDVWPIAYSIEDMIAMSAKDRIEMTYRLSNPLVRKCFDEQAIHLHRHLSLEGSGSDFGLTYSQIPRAMTLPKPTYEHRK